MMVDLKIMFYTNKNRSFRYNSRKSLCLCANVRLKKNYEIKPCFIGAL